MKCNKRNIKEIKNVESKLKYLTFIHLFWSLKSYFNLNKIKAVDVEAVLKN